MVIIKKVSRLTGDKKVAKSHILVRTEINFAEVTIKFINLVVRQ